ncbi:MUC19, putative [Brugia malayi]|uniref:BMA-MAC-1 n=2 Tax=Brugia malayi TaxID=6279 RepID=A0A0I9N7J8_BRUMA|nr:MUC19, putative [Brugia malayi]CTP81969.1 BMA-MAC-1 [Brugia malayi]VIO92391.1 MUC19, putative [Brugia malayi]
MMQARKASSGFRSDPRLVPRIRDVWQANEACDAEDVAHYLQQTYPEYARRKFRDFLKSVEIGLGKIKNANVVDGVIDLTNESNDMSTIERKRKLMTKTMKRISPTNDKPEANQKKHRKSYASFGSLYKADINVEPSASYVTFTDIGGCEQQCLEVCSFVIHLFHPEIDDLLGVTHPTGFLLHGPPGCGKTLFAQAVAGQFNLPILKVAVTELVSGVSGESEQKIRLLFTKAIEASPCILLLDDIDAIASKRDNAQREMERRIVSQLIACLDDLSNPRKDVELNTNSIDIDISVRKMHKGNRVLVIGTTSRVETIDPALRRAGRFDKEIALGIPDKRARSKILEIVCKDLRLDERVILQELARLTPGYVGADLKALSSQAASCAVKRAVNGKFGTPGICKYGEKNIGEIQLELEKMLTWLQLSQQLDNNDFREIRITMEDFNRALVLVDPSAKREGFATVPDITWNDIGALETVREELKWSILVPIQKPELFREFGMESKPQGILLCGPPGCGKTLLAKAVANESGMNFISIKGPELLSMYVGESERAVRTVFQRARDSSPCVIFFDEIDALCPKRTSSETSGSSRLVNQLLTEMDGIESRKEVFLIGATNRPDIVDGAILRPGRLDKILFVDFPNTKEKEDILCKITKNGKHPHLSDDFSYKNIAADPALEWFTGADIAALVHEAGIIAMQESISGSNTDGYRRVTMKHFQNAAQRIRPSVPEKDRLVYQKLKEMYGKLRSE